MRVYCALAAATPLLPTRFRLRVPAARLCASPAGRIGYVTDVEGDLAFWSRYVGLSRCIVNGGGGEPDLDALDLAPGAQLVFGGDSVDKGGADLRFLRSLLSLQERHPGRVHTVLGNRDINKMRLLAELSPTHMLPAAGCHGVYWRRQAPTATPAAFLARQPAGPQQQDTRAARLRWMLGETMGAPNAFENRRAELAALGGGGGGGGATAGGRPDDDAVLASFVGEALRPAGVVRRYLEGAKVAVRLGSVLFVHGAVRAANLGRVPNRAARCESVDEWVAALNTFAAAEVAAYCDAADDFLATGATAWPGSDDRLGAGFFRRPGGALMAYGMARQHDGTPSPTVVYASFLQDGHARPVEPEVVRFLAAGGITTLVTGHQPHGDSPVVMRCATDDGAELTVVTADTSFSAEVEWTAGDGDGDGDGAAREPEFPPGRTVALPTPQWGPPRGPPPPPRRQPRGGAAVEVLLRDGGGVEVHGRLSDGSEIDFDAIDDAIGTETAEGWWVKGRSADGGLLLSRGKGYRVENRVVEESSDKS